MLKSMRENQQKQGSGSMVSVKEVMSLAYKNSSRLGYRFHESEFYSLFEASKVATIANVVKRILYSAVR